MQAFKYYDAENELYGYSPNDVLYVNAIEACKTSVPPCDPNSNTEENQKNCLAQELCVNQAMIQSSMQSRASNGRYIDSKNMYVSQIVHCVNLVIGCIGLGVLIYRNNK